MNIKQRTIQFEIELSGIGLHTGCEATIRFKPAPINHGVIFKRVDLPHSDTIPALIDYVTDIQRGTTLSRGEAKVSTVEHVLSAAYGLGIDNLLIELDAPEPPRVDGSALPFVHALRQAQIVIQDAPRQYFTLDRPVIYHNDETRTDLVIVPSDEFRVTYMIEYNHKGIGTQYTSLYDLEREFTEDFAAARTFCLLSEVEQLKERGLIQGGMYDNALVFIDRPIKEHDFSQLKRLFGIPDTTGIGDNGILGNSELRFYNEPVRHKVVDLIGDLALLGMPIRGHILAARAGHAAHVELAKMLRKMQQTEQMVKKYQVKSSRDFVFDIEAIEKILPHRFPFLLVDRILELTPGEFVTGVKNVTINEPFFQGHFPGRPIMPGVLIVEAMGQVGGILLLNSSDNPSEKLVYFTGLDNVKFKRTVTPGDQLFIKVEMNYFRRGICKMKGTAYVANTLVAEAEMQAVIVDRNPVPR
ncbi:MAG: bifunctional UDP-3-O-[3-hydroxymyristoyl] N-acetylglucosamine deacetylase/3-hydroxyacyl-ACP dehydratase [bacterium]|nr:bifunctional UDP-3-O-[3-hydroxymyristoyl] N-acetylglucosamine deacetylase/3-hydroxyacyl-ACP dehydratase [bacterium]